MTREEAFWVTGESRIVSGIVSFKLPVDIKKNAQMRDVSLSFIQVLLRTIAGRQPLSISE